MVRVVERTYAPPPIVTDFGSNLDAVIGCGLTWACPDTPAPAHAGPGIDTSGQSPIRPVLQADETSSRHHPEKRTLVLAPLLSISEAAKATGYRQSRPDTRARPARCSVCGRSARNRSVCNSTSPSICRSKTCSLLETPSSPRRQLLSFSSACQPTNRLSSDGRPQPRSYAVTLRATGSQTSPCSRVQLGQPRQSRLGSPSGATQAAGTIGLTPPPAFPAQPAERCDVPLACDTGCEGGRSCASNGVEGTRG